MSDILTEITPGIDYDETCRTYYLSARGDAYNADEISEEGETLCAENTEALLHAATGVEDCEEIPEPVLIDGRSTIVLSLGDDLPEIHGYRRDGRTVWAVA